jgi:hypothetical protein
MKDHRMNDLEDGDRKQNLVSASGESRDALNRFAIERGVLALVNQDRLDEAWAACEIAMAAVKFDPGWHYFSASNLQELNRMGEAMTACNSTSFPRPPQTSSPFIAHGYPGLSLLESVSTTLFLSAFGV